MHFVYPENICKYIPIFKLGNEIVYTLHQPSEYYSNGSMKNLDKVDKIIVMAKSMIIPLQKITGKHNVEFISLVTVGQWASTRDSAEAFLDKINQGVVYDLN